MAERVTTKQPYQEFENKSVGKSMDDDSAGETAEVVFYHFYKQIHNDKKVF